MVHVQMDFLLKLLRATFTKGPDGTQSRALGDEGVHAQKCTYFSLLIKLNVRCSAPTHTHVFSALEPLATHRGDAGRPLQDVPEGGVPISDKDLNKEHPQVCDYMSGWKRVFGLVQKHC